MISGVAGLEKWAPAHVIWVSALSCSILHIYPIEVIFQVSNIGEGRRFIYWSDVSGAEAGGRSSVIQMTWASKWADGPLLVLMTWASKWADGPLLVLMTWASKWVDGPLLVLMTWASFRTALGPRWYTSPPSPSARSRRRILSTTRLGPGICNWAASSGLLIFGFWAGKHVATSGGALTSSDLEVVRTINALPRRISARHLVECLSFEDCGQKAFELMTTPAPRQSNFMAARKRTGASSSSARPNAPTVPRPPLTGRSSSGGRLPPMRITQKPKDPQAAQAVGSSGKAAGSDPHLDLAAVQVDLSSEAATTAGAPLIRKRKDPFTEGRKDKEGSSSRSTSKKARKGKDKEKDRERVPVVPLPGGIFSPAFNMSERTKFHMSSSQRALIEPLSELELTNAMLEMSTRVSALAWYLKEFVDRPGVAKIRAELDAEKKNSASLQLTMELMLLTQDDYDKKIEQLEADLERSKKENAKGLVAARGEQERLAEEGRQLKAEVARLRDAEAEHIKANQALSLDVTKANEKIAELEATIVFEHEEGFNKALRQASLLAGVQDPFTLGFDIEKDIFDGVLDFLFLFCIVFIGRTTMVPFGANGQGSLYKFVYCPTKLRVVFGGTSFHRLGLYGADGYGSLKNSSFIARPS
ncbi:hypothetical protein LR48_Vigan08g144800 [Vigna angularis]|uniref:Uncharacterized protein n=1 Tax=Phaseolus angularis TaxID=3914 RepID=A0A0L9V6E5_PHAAN|nr:hypothetical protein LR48_Vigan08g144800 [Vigna angularis]